MRWILALIWHRFAAWRACRMAAQGDGGAGTTRVVEKPRQGRAVMRDLILLTLVSDLATIVLISVLL